MRRTQKLLIFVLAVTALGSSQHSPAPRKHSGERWWCAPIPTTCRFPTGRGQGFENKLAELLARDMHAQIEYVWWAQRRGYVRSTLDEGRCDLWPGVATGVDMVSYHASVLPLDLCFVTRADAAACRADAGRRAAEIAVHRRADDRQRRHQHTAGAGARAARHDR